MILLANLTENLDVALLGYLIVFLALILLYGIFSLMPKAIDYFAKKRLRAAGKVEIAEKDTLDISGTDGAAIAMALHLFFEEQHDEESNVITIKEVSRRYSPWSSKLYGMREVPQIRRSK